VPDGWSVETGDPYTLIEDLFKPVPEGLCDAFAGFKRELGGGGLGILGLRLAKRLPHETELLPITAAPPAQAEVNAQPELLPPGQFAIQRL
jgi:hypothetical protein